MKKLTFLALVLVTAFAFAQKDKNKAAPTPDPWAGTWKFDAAQSKLNAPAPREATITSYSTGADHMTVRYDVRGVGADGIAMNQSYAGKADGKAYPLMANGQ